jgi:hypothetical protein
MMTKMTKGATEANAETAEVKTGVEADAACEGETAEKKRKLPAAFIVVAAAVVLFALGLGIWYIASDNKPLVVNVPVSQPGAGNTSSGTTIGETKPPKAGALAGTEEGAEGAGGAEGSGEGAEDGATGDEGSGAGDGGGSSGGTGGSDGGSGGGSSGGSGGASTSSPGKTWHDGWNEWVVDVPGHNEQRLVRGAWDEETGHYGAVCNDCGVELFPPAGQHLIDTGHSGYTTGVWFKTGTIHHDAVYETVWVPETGHWVRHEGYWQ